MSEVVSRRRGVDKKKSAKQFNRDSKKTDKKNVAGPPCRGGYRA